MKDLTLQLLALQCNAMGLFLCDGMLGLVTSLHAISSSEPLGHSDALNETSPKPLGQQVASLSSLLSPLHVPSQGTYCGQSLEWALIPPWLQAFGDRACFFFHLPLASGTLPGT